MLDARARAITPRCFFLRYGRRLMLRYVID